MPLKYRLALVFFWTFFVLVFSVHAHGPSPAHVRRSLAFKKKLHRQLDIPGAVGNLVGDLLGGGSTSTPGKYTTISFLFLSNLFPRPRFHVYDYVGRDISSHH